MADPTLFIFNQAGAVQRLTDTLAGTVKLRLVTGTALSGSSVIGDVATNELSGNGYPVGGLTLTSPTVSWDAADGRAEAAYATVNLTPSGANLTWRQAAITVNNGTDYIWGVYQWANDETATDGVAYPFTVKLAKGAEGATVNISDS